MRELRRRRCLHKARAQLVRFLEDATFPKGRKGILVDRETSKEIVEDGACLSSKTTREATWPATQGRRPPFKQFQHEADGIVDISCMRKATTMLERNGFPTSQPYVIPARGRKDPFKHLWLEDYNAPLLDFFASQAAKGR